MEAPGRTGGKGFIMGKSRARVPAFYRQSIQNAVNQQINIGKSKHRTMLNREAIGQVVSYCTITAAHDLLDWGEKESTILTLKMNNAASRYILDHDKYGAPEAKKRLEERTAHLMPEEFWLPAGDLVGSEKKLRILAERRDAAKMIIRFMAESLEEMEYIPEQIEAVKKEAKANYDQFLEWSKDGEEVAYDRLRRVIEDIYGVGAMVERVEGEDPIFGKPLFKKDF